VTFVSFAQNREDVVLARAFPGPRGFYIDVGASDPVVDSVTKHFYDRGWRGVNIEPAINALEALRAARPRDVNLGTALGEAPGETRFYELPQQMTGCSTVSSSLADAYRQEGWAAEEREVEVATLAQICEQHAAGEQIDFLKIDVEGAEREVLAGADFERFTPRVVVVEATAPGGPIPTYADWEPLLLDTGYDVVLFDGLNRFYVRSEDTELHEALAAPANYFDDYVTREERELEERLREQSEDVAFAREELVRQGASAQSALRRAERQEAGRRSVEEALDQTRNRLARSQAALRDARAELEATRAALNASIAHEPS
jgi:FkbM family methyltransferase